ncbi:MAG: DUF1573 domain-containing protein [Planctomycetota bacterium]|jgi:hypothetical protein
MKRDCLILTVIVGFILLFQVGCEHQNGVSEEPETGVVEANKTVKVEPPEALTPRAPSPAQESPEDNPTTAEGQESKPRKSVGPKITFEKVTHDFGDISPGSKNTCEFKFKNTGDALLRIGKISSTCGCTVPELKKKEYAAGESGVIKARYSASRAAGRITKRLHVPSNDKQNSKVALTIKATIVKKVSHEPNRIKFLLKSENAGCPQIKLKSIDGRAFAVKSFGSTGGSITAASDPNKNATEFVFDPKVDIKKLKRRSTGQIKINLTHPGCPSINIPFSVLPEFQINPNAIVLRNVVPQKPVKRNVSVVNNYGEDFEIESVSSDKDATRVLSREKVENGYELVLEVTPPPTQNYGSVFRDVFSVTIKGGPKLTLSCRCFYSTKKKKR